MEVMSIKWFNLSEKLPEIGVDVLVREGSDVDVARLKRIVSKPQGGYECYFIPSHVSAYDPDWGFSNNSIDKWAEITLD